MTANKLTVVFEKLRPLYIALENCRSGYCNGNPRDGRFARARREHYLNQIDDIRNQILTVLAGLENKNGK